MRKLTTKEFIGKSKELFGENYFDYSKTKYITGRIPLILICKKHNIEFEVLPMKHLTRNQSCKICGNEKNDRKIPTKEFINRSKELFGENYFDYSKTKYKGKGIPLILICKKHNIEFEARPDNHLFRKQSCKICGNENYFIKRSNNLTDFILKGEEIHNKKYNYSKFIYKGIDIKSIIICKKHGEFNQSPYLHINLGCGCPKCGKTNLSEMKIFSFLKILIHNIKSQAKPKWLGRQSLDMYCEYLGIAIEYQGRQHFTPVKDFGGDKAFTEIKERDERKRLLCEQNGCKLFYFTYTPKDVPSDYPHKVYSDEQELKQAIEDHIQSLNKKVA